MYMYNNREREELIEKMKKVVTGWDEGEEERNVAWILTWHAEMSPLLEEWRNCGRRGLCRSKG